MATSIVGRPGPRVDARAKVTGAAGYAADLHPDRLAHGYLLLSTIGHGSVRSMDTTAAQASPGVLAVYTPFHPLPLYPDPTGVMTGQNWVPLGDTGVRYHGQAIGLVVAETFEQARAGAALVGVEYDPLPVAASLVDGLPTATPAPPSVSGPPVSDVLAEGVPSIDAALSASQVTVSGTYTQPMAHHNPIEPHVTLAEWDAGTLTVHGPTQSPTGHAQSIATGLGVDPAAVRVISPYLGGGFGGKAVTWAHTLLTAAAARALGRPVRTELTREQMFTVTGHRSAQRQAVTLGAGHDGRLVAVRHEAYAAASTSGGMFDSPASTVSRLLYRTPNLHAQQWVVALDVPPCTIMRAPGEAASAFAVESAMDELAAALGIDPLDLRLRNYATVVPGTTTGWSGKHLDECYRIGASRFGWSGRPIRPDTLRDGDWSVGLGMASAILGAYRFPTQARVRFQAEGSAAVDCATVDLGTGMWTVLTRVAADALGLPPERIRPHLGDSALPPNLGAFGSSSTASVSSALVGAASAAIAALVQHAVTDPRSPLHGTDPAAVAYRSGMLVHERTRVDFGALLRATGSPGIEASAGDSGGDPAAYAYNSFGAHFCEVRVHRPTGRVRLARVTTVVDAGRLVNPTTARSQIIGGVVMGIGHALYEGARLEARNGRIANANLADYLVPVNADVPPVDVCFVEHPDTLFTPLGVRGLGEIGVVGVAAAIANAVYHATGIRVRDLPITLDTLLG